MLPRFLRRVSHGELDVCRQVCPLDLLHDLLMKTHTMTHVLGSSSLSSYVESPFYRPYLPPLRSFASYEAPEQLKYTILQLNEIVPQG